MLQETCYLLVNKLEKENEIHFIYIETNITNQFSS